MKKNSMGSWKSSSSKSLLDPDAMLDFEDQLDYEPDSDESDSDYDVLVTKQDFIKNVEKFSLKEPNQEEKLDSEENDKYLEDQDHAVQLPEPSGQVDQDSSNRTSSERQSLSYGTDLEKTPSATRSIFRSVSSSYRDKIRYNELHIDVEKGSCQSKYGQHTMVNDSVYLDSSSEEEDEYSDFQDGSAKGGANSGKNLDYENTPNFEDTSEESQQEDPSYETYYPSSENSQTYENMVSPKDIWEDSPQSGATTVMVGNSDVPPNLSLTHPSFSPRRNQTTGRDVPPSWRREIQNGSRVSPQKTITTVRTADRRNISPHFEQSTQNDDVASNQKKRGSFNFSIKVVGNERICLIPKDRVIKRRQKRPWVSKVENYIDESDIVKLCSKDEVIEFLPESQKSGIKSRLGKYPDNTNSYTSESDSDLSLFKVPLKRPPTRQKSSNKNLSVSVNLQSQLRQVEDMGPLFVGPVTNNPKDKDDIISLMASSCHLSIADDLNESQDRHNNIFIKEEPISLPGSFRGTEEAKFERTAQWVSKANEPRKTPVPSIYKGLCYNYFLNNNCKDKGCTRSHLLISPHTQIAQLPLLNIELLKEAYEFAIEYFFLYSQIYKLFAKAFALKDMKNELIKMINIIFEETCYQIDLEEGLDTVLSALQMTNLTTFEDTVEYLLLQIGLKHYPTLGNVLLELILKKPDLSRHWSIIRRLIIAGEKMNCKLGTKFLVHLMKSPVNLKICQEVYHYILSYKCVDLPMISASIRKPFLKICSQESIARETAEIEANIERNLRKERSNFERTIQGNANVSNLTIQQDFSVPPPKTAFGRAQLPPSLNYLPPSEFGSSSSKQPDFASLSRQETHFAAQPALQTNNMFSCPPPALNSSPHRRSNEDGKTQPSEAFHDVDLRYRSPVVRKHRNNNNGSSDDEESQHEARISNSDLSTEQNSDYLHPALLGVRKRRAHTGLMYKREGLYYDPANDYVPPPKKRTIEPLNEFDQLKESSARPNYDSQRMGPILHRTNHEKAQFRGNFNEKRTGLTMHRANLNEERAGLAFEKPNHDDQGLGSALHRANLDEVGVELTFNRPNHDNQQLESALHRANLDEEGGELAFHISNQHDQELGSAMHRANLDEEITGLTLHRPNHGLRPALHRANINEDGARLAFERPISDDEVAEPAIHRSNLDNQRARPALHRPNIDEDRMGPAFHRQNHNDEGAGSAFSRPNHEDQRARPLHHRPQHNQQEVSRSDQNTRSKHVPVRQREFTIMNNEAAVSSSSDAKLKHEKPPEHPQFGKLYFDPNYEFDISLHNLYLEAIDNVDIDEGDVYKLNDCIKKSDGKAFLELVEKYKGPKTVQNFISMALAHLKGMNQMVARIYQRLLNSIEKEYPGFYGNLCYRVVLEVITMNLLFELFNRHMLEYANIFLNRFSNWDSLVTSRIFIISSTRGISIIGRYLFIAKILNYSKPELTYEILVCPTLHLLEKYEIWPYNPPCPIPEIFNADLDSRNTVITVFLKTGYLLNPVSVIQLYKTAFRKEIWEFDVKSYINPMMIDVINRNHTSLKLFNNEIKLFYKYMTKDTLRAFLISLCQYGNEIDLFLLYEKCVERGVYQKLVKGDSMEYTIEIKTNMHMYEIELIVKYYFLKLQEIKKVPSGSEPLRFDIKLPGEAMNSKALPILNKNNSLVQTSDILKKSLQKLPIKSTSVLASVVEVEKEELVNYLERIWT